MTDLAKRYTKSVAQTSPYSMRLEVSGAYGSYIAGKIGDSPKQHYLDFVSGMAVSALGHKDRAVMDAVYDQVHTHSYTGVYGEHVHKAQVELAEEVLKYFPEDHQVFFTNSGAEANELALKMTAKHFRDRVRSPVAIKGGFHGRTLGTMAISSNEKYKVGIPNVFGVDYLEPNNFYELDMINWSQVSGVFMELVQGEAGAWPLMYDWVQGIARRCEASQSFLVVDEVQTGWGRTGSMLAQHQYQVRPTITTIGKALGGGFPIGGVVAPRSLFEELQDPPFSHVTTFGGHPVSCAAGLATLRQIPQHLDNVNERSKQLTEFFANYGLSSTGLGLMLGIHFFGDSKEAHTFVDGCLDRGLILGYKLNNSASVRVSPPLNITEEEVGQAIQIMGDVLVGMGYTA